MNTEQNPQEEIKFGCEECMLRQNAEDNPKSFKARLWRWHTRWCPGWKAYQNYLASQNRSPESV